MKRSFGAQAVAYPLPVFFIGTYNISGKPHAMLEAYGGLCCSEPPAIAIALRSTHKSYQHIQEKKEYTISIPSAPYVNETDAFGISVNDDIDKFEKTGLTPVKAEKVDAPYVGEFPVVMECRLIKTIPIGSHIQIIGEIVDLKIDENILDSDGYPTVSIINPLGFDILRSEYYSMGGVVGKAYDCGRKYLL